MLHGHPLRGLTMPRGRKVGVTRRGVVCAIVGNVSRRFRDGLGAAVHRWVRVASSCGSMRGEWAPQDSVVGSASPSGAG